MDYDQAKALGQFLELIFEEPEVKETFRDLSPPQQLAIKHHVRTMLADLPQFELAITEQRYGLGEGYVYTSTETAKIFKRTRLMIQQTENKAILLCRSKITGQSFADFVAHTAASPP